MLAIAHRNNSFSHEWIQYCEKHNVPYKTVDPYSSDIIAKTADCRGFMWHWAHHDPKAVLFARQLTHSLERVGLKVFPDTNTGWHFDDKIGQKYLLESIRAPVVPSYVFYDKVESLAWAQRSDYPKVFKLRSGAGAENVKLVADYSAAKRMIRRMFGKGHRAKRRLHSIKERLWHYRRDKTFKSFIALSKGIARILWPDERLKKLPVEKNYFYLQEFIPHNDHDIRVIVVGHRAFAIKRMVRKGDFRASGSGTIIHDPAEIPIECIKLAFTTSKRLQAQCLAYDFIYDDSQPRIIEISYAFAPGGYTSCPGYWNEELNWTATSFTPQHFIIEDFIRDCDVR
ncbi:hypothetical protein [Pelagicoccus sp. SDUM812002]|uniref:ATP-grasp domain-containing protein n=1 Tax=Pelagicoccus sp. SDUM812002 TaxID=3041266 RepID=UPI00280DF775|nr:hypothetical protein [Pelagicoccus sp. SDUM812002]MDQ8186294.1 hypothetical protein [Pelagicoccus sp. SDUM812002]